MDMQMIFQPLNIYYRISFKMKIEKENQFNTFSKLLRQIDAKNVGLTEIKMLKQEHDYLDKLRQQRVKIEDLKARYNQIEIQLKEQQEENDNLKETIDEQNRMLEDLQGNLEAQTKKRQNLQKTLQKQVELDKGKNKFKISELTTENQELRKNLKTKQLLIFTLEEQHNEKIKQIKEGFLNQKKIMMIDCEEKVKEVKCKINEGEVVELRNLVTRQNKALKMQNQKYEEQIQKNTLLSQQISQLESDLEKKVTEVQEYEEHVGELNMELEDLQKKFTSKSENEKLKDQLEEVRKKMNQMTKGEIERIEFIVNEFD